MKTQCPNCKSGFNVDEKSAGKQAKCPKCSQPFTIEAFVETPASPAEDGGPSFAQGATRGEQRTENRGQKTEDPASPKGLRRASGGQKTGDRSEKTEDNNLSSVIGSPSSEIPAVPAAKSASKTALPKILFVYCWIVVRIIAGVLAGLGLMLAIRKGAHSTLIMTFAAADVFLVFSVAIELMLFYRMWAAIKDDRASISPAKAVAFLFIPVFNIYWALLMLTGFAEDYNAFVRRRSIKAKDLSFALFLIYAFAFILAAAVVTTPMVCVFAFVRRISGAFVGYPELFWPVFCIAFTAGAAHFITYILVAIKTCNAINALSQTKGG